MDNEKRYLEYIVYIVYNITTMGKRYLKPTSYRDKQCPYCGLYFSPRGLNGHIRFKHAGDHEISLFKLTMQTEKKKILNILHTDEGLKQAVRFFLFEYLNKE